MSVSSHAAPASQSDSLAVQRLATLIGLWWTRLWMQVTAVAYDTPIPGFKTRNCINLRLWAAKPSREFDLEAFNTGDYVQAST
jgi:glucan phosphorylase